MLNWLKNLFKGHGAAAIREALVGMAVHQVQENGKVVLDTVIKKITDHHRGELFVFIKSMTDDYAREGLLTWLRSFGENDNRAVTLLTRVYLVIKDDPTKHWIFTDIGYMEDKERDQMLNMLEHNVIPQWFRQAGNYLAPVDRGAASAVRAIRNFLGERGIR